MSSCDPSSLRSGLTITEAPADYPASDIPLPEGACVVFGDSGAGGIAIEFYTESQGYTELEEYFAGVLEDLGWTEAGQRVRNTINGGNRVQIKFAAPEATVISSVVIGENVVVTIIENSDSPGWRFARIGYTPATE
jgi:hypothetical protein